MKSMDNHTTLAFIIIGVLFVFFLASFLLLLKCKRRPYICGAITSGVLCVGFSLLCVLSIDVKVTVEIQDNPVAVYATDPINGGYRYGASILKDEDGNVETFFSGDYTISTMWDVVTYRASNDNGKTWGEEKATLIPIQNSDEHYSNCDPGAFKVGEYYYVGYTSTFDARGTYNYIYCARSKTPSNPASWEKWNGNGWGGNQPAPILEYFGTQTQYGIGEVSFVFLDNTVYAYYTYVGTLGNGAEVRQTRVATAPYSENWCAHLTDIGVARNDRGPTEDSMDVKYIPELKKFISVTTDSRFTENSFIRIYMSDDGVAFYEVDCNSEKALKGLHNIGISGDYNGHLKLDESQFVIYSYGIGKWGKWDTALSYITFETQKVINFGKLFYRGAQNPVGATKDSAWGLTSVENQDEDIPKGTFAATNVLKDDTSYFWSENYAQSRYSTALAVKAKKRNVKGVEMRPIESLEGVPVDFYFEYSDDGVIWKRVQGSEVKGFTATEYKTYTFAFEQPVRARYVRIVAETLGRLGLTELYALQVEYFSTY